MRKKKKVIDDRPAKVYCDNGRVFQCDKHTTILSMLHLSGHEDWIVDDGLDNCSYAWRNGYK